MFICFSVLVCINIGSGVVCVCLCLEDFICDCAYSVMNNVHKVVLSSKQVVSEVVMHLFWLSNRSAGVFLLPI